MPTKSGPRAKRRIRQTAGEILGVGRGQPTFVCNLSAYELEIVLVARWYRQCSKIVRWRNKTRINSIRKGYKRVTLSDGKLGQVWYGLKLAMHTVQGEIPCPHNICSHPAHEPKVAGTDRGSKMRVMLLLASDDYPRELR